MVSPSFDISIVSGDVLEVEAQVLVLKYAQDFYGADQVLASRLAGAGILDLASFQLEAGQCRLFPSPGGVVAPHVLFVGTAPLASFRYQEVRIFARQALAFLGQELPSARRVAFTIHGPGAGLDEIEALESQVAGLVDAASAGELPAALGEVLIVEIVRSRAERLSTALGELLPGMGAAVRPEPEARSLGTARGGSRGGDRSRAVSFELESRSSTSAAARLERSSERLRSAGYASASKPHVFVAMPFAEEMDDVFHFGIQGPVRAAGYLCERADLEIFSGDIVHWIRQRISTASLVVADLTGANPNVYLEVGFAWGCGVRTVLLVRDAAELKFDVKGQRCLVYRRIKDLHDSLEKELAALGPPG